MEKINKKIAVCHDKITLYTDRAVNGGGKKSLDRINFWDKKLHLLLDLRYTELMSK